MLAHAQLGARVAQVVITGWGVDTGEEQPVVGVAVGAEALVVLAGGLAQAGIPTFGSGAGRVSGYGS